MRSTMFLLTLLVAAAVASAQDFTLDWIYRDQGGGGDYVVIRTARARPEDGESVSIRIPLGRGADAVPIEARRTKTVPERVTRLRSFLVTFQPRRLADEYLDSVRRVEGQAAWLRFRWGPPQHERKAIYLDFAPNSRFPVPGAEGEQLARLVAEVEKAFPAEGESLPWDRTASAARDALLAHHGDPACPEGVRVLVALAWTAHRRAFAAAGTDLTAELLQSPSAAVRAAAAHARSDELEESTSELVRILGPMIQDADPAVAAKGAERAADLLRQARELGPILDLWAEGHLRGGAKPEGFPAVVKVLRTLAPEKALRLVLFGLHPDASETLTAEARKALEAIAKETPDLRNKLAEATRDPDPRVRSVAVATGLERFGADSLEMVAGALGQTEPWVHLRAAPLLAKLDDLRAFDLLLTIAKGADRPAATEAMKALAQRPDGVPFDRVRGEIVPLALWRAMEEPAYREALDRYVDAPSLRGLLERGDGPAAREWWRSHRDRLWWDGEQGKFQE